MEARLRSFITLGVLGLVLVLAGVWGFSAVMEPFPERAEAPLCVDRQFAQGERVSRGDVTVSVYNAGDRVGLAGLTMDLLVDAGFAAGNEGNTSGPREVARAEIWTRDPDSPAVELVRSHLGRVKVIERAPEGVGVTVVVGDKFDDLVQGKRTVKAKQAASVCGPPRGT